MIARKNDDLNDNMCTCDREPTDGSGGGQNVVSSVTAEEMQAMAAEYADGYPSGMYLISFPSLSFSINNLSAGNMEPTDGSGGGLNVVSRAKIKLLP